MSPSLTVECSGNGRNFDFILGEGEENPVKLAKVMVMVKCLVITICVQVVKEWDMSENNPLAITLGPNVDILFLCVCAAATGEILTAAAAGGSA